MSDIQIDWYDLVMELNQAITDLKGVGERTAKLLAKLDIHTIEDLVEHFPRKYQDYSNTTDVADARPGQLTLKGKLADINGRYMRKGLHLTTATIDDGSGKLALSWFNQPYRKDSIKPDTNYFVSGELGYKNGHYSILNPAVELVSDFPTNTARIIPIYDQTKGLKSHTIRKLIKSIIKSVNFDETLPKSVVSKSKLLTRKESVNNVHFPKDEAALIRAKERLAFEEVFQLMLANQINKRANGDLKGRGIEFHEDKTKELVSSLPFKLTDDQRAAAWKILQDMNRSTPMNRLLEGDVGSGKTVVAAIAALNSASNSKQTAIIAPTEILAKQHFQTLKEVYKGQKVHTELLVSKMKKSERVSILDTLSSGKTNVIVGTHALLQKDVVFNDLSLIVIDEQHRFGVDQRLELQKQSKQVPHVLTMTATPIPRTLALTLYGELDISRLKEKPTGRKSIATKLVDFTNRAALYRSIQKTIDKKEQVFVVAPLIEDSELSASLSVNQLSKDVARFLPKARIKVLHGRLKTEDKDHIMDEFVQGKSDILISTTVIEVGIDVPNATTMIIEGADRFGLAQLHQLRGRVGRADKSSSCYIISSPGVPPSQRLHEMTVTNDGFKLAAADLKYRGAGEIYGLRQHGALDLKIAKLTDVGLINQAKALANEFLDSEEDLLEYSHLNRKVQGIRNIVNLN